MRKEYDYKEIILETKFADLKGVIFHSPKDLWTYFFIYNTQEDIDQKIQEGIKKVKDHEIEFENYEEMNADFYGYIKWDGCSEFKSYYHICGLYGLDNLTDFYKDIYGLSLKILEEYGHFN